MYTQLSCIKMAQKRPQDNRIPFFPFPPLPPFDLTRSTKNGKTKRRQLTGVVEDFESKEEMEKRSLKTGNQRGRDNSASLARDKTKRSRIRSVLHKRGGN